MKKIVVLLLPRILCLTLKSSYLSELFSILHGGLVYALLELDYP